MENKKLNNMTGKKSPQSLPSNSNSIKNNAENNNELIQTKKGKEDLRLSGISDNHCKVQIPPIHIIRLMRM